MRYLESDEETRASLGAAAVGLNRELYALNRLTRDAFSRASRDGRVVPAHEEAGANISLLNDAVSLMSGRDAAGAADILENVGFGRYADYDVRVCDYFASQDGAGTWAEGREAGPVCRADVVIRSLRQKIAAGDADLSAEIDETNELLAGEDFLLREILEEELLRIEELAPRISKLVSDMAPLLAEEQ
jgi:hypothetical protein